MILWWVGNAALVLVILPVVLLLLQRLLRPTLEIGSSVNDIETRMRHVVERLDDAALLTTTRRSVSQVSRGLDRYVRAVDRML